MVPLQKSAVATGWCLVIPLDEAHRAVSLRHSRDVEACIAQEELWLRGKTLPEDQGKLLTQIPGARAFVIVERGQLVPVGKSVPCGWLPEGTWRPVSQYVQLAFPEAQSYLPNEKASPRVSLALVRSTCEQVPNLLLTDVGTWTNYVAPRASSNRSDPNRSNTPWRTTPAAPSWRLERWAFVANKSGQVLVRGTPLPALPGQQWVERDGIAVPAGWTWRPAIDVKVLRKILQLEPGDMALLGPQSTWQRVRSTDWVRATRSSVRSTEEAMHAPL